MNSKKFFNSRYKLKKGYLVLLLLLLILFAGTSFALWQITFKQKDDNTITTGCFNVVFSDKNPINIKNASPISEEAGRKLVPYEFTIKNVCDNFAAYQINLEILDNTDLDDYQYIRLLLNEENESDVKSKLLIANATVATTLDNAVTSYTLKSGYLESNDTKTFNLRLWLDKDTPAIFDIMDKVFDSKIVVNTTYSKDAYN